MIKKYNNPPIVEALCQFQFVPGQPWDLTIPGLLYEKIKHEFPEKKQQLGYGIGLRPKVGSLEQKAEMTQRMQFFRHDKSALVQIDTDLLTINYKKPYPNWESFKPVILNILGIYNNIAEPKSYKRIGLRYINIVELDKGPIELRDYFNYYPFIPSKLPQAHDAFNVRIEIPHENGRDRLLLTLASMVPEKPDVMSLLLDLDYIMTKPESISFDETQNWIEKAHSVVENAFEACITDKCRSLF